MKEKSSFKKTSAIILLVLIFAGIFSVALAEGKISYWQKAMNVSISVCTVGIAEQKSNSVNSIIVRDLTVPVETITVFVAGDRPIKINFMVACCNPLDIVIINEEGKICRYSSTIRCDSCKKAGTLTINESCYLVCLSPGENAGYGRNDIELAQLITLISSETTRGMTQEETVKRIIDELFGDDSVGVAQVVISSGKPRARKISVNARGNTIEILADTDLPANTKLLWSFSGPLLKSPASSAPVKIDISDERTVVDQNKKVKLRINSGGLLPGEYFLTVKTLADRIEILSAEITLPLEQKAPPTFSPTPTLIPTPTPTPTPTLMLTPKRTPVPTRTPTIQTGKRLTPIPAPTQTPKASIYFSDIIIASAAVIILSLRKKTRVFS